MSTQLDHHLKLWNLSDPQPLAQTVTSNVYTVLHQGERVVLKILSDVGEEERVGAIALRHWNGHGAVRLIHSDDGAHLMEYADGESLDGWVKRGDDAASTEVIATVIEQLHSVQSVPPDGLYALDRWFRDLFTKAEQDARAGSNSIYERGAKVARALLADPREVRVLHGDVHHENVRQSRRGWLAFDPKGLVGERTYDTANTLCNLIYRGTETDPAKNEARISESATILSERLGIERKRILTYTFAYCCLSAAWSLRVPELMPEEDMANHTLQIAAMVEPHISKI
jgi:streptomycin 6-kinase